MKRARWKEFKRWLKTGYWPIITKKPIAPYSSGYIIDKHIKVKIR